MTPTYFDQNAKKKIIFKLTTRVSTGLIFLENLIFYDDLDIAHIRSFYMLFSYYFELQLKSIYILENNFTDKLNLDDKLKNVGHNLIKVSNIIGNNKLKDYCILSISYIKNEFIINSKPYKFKIKHFTTIRYDFLDDIVEKIDITCERDNFLKQIETMQNINRIIKNKNSYIPT